jgi:hypothetical protein
MYSGISAKELFSSGKRVNPNIIPLKTLWKFIETYFVKKGFLDGYRGFIVAMGATYSMFWKYIQLWELSRKDK